MKRQGHLAADNQVGVDAYDSSTPSPIDAFLGGALEMGLLAELKQGGRGPSTAIEHQSVTASKRVRAGVFNVHAATSATTKEERERLIRYCARPPLSLSRLSRTPDGQVAYQLKNPIGRKTHRLLSPEEFLARLCALIPPPRHPLIRFHGVVAPNSRWRPLVVPRAQTPDSSTTSRHPTKPTFTTPSTTTGSQGQGPVARRSLSSIARLPFQQGPGCATLWIRSTHQF